MANKLFAWYELFNLTLCMTPIYILFVMLGLLPPTLWVNFLGEIWEYKCQGPSKSYVFFNFKTSNFHLIFFSFKTFFYFYFFFIVCLRFHYLVLESQSNNFRPRTSTNGLKGHYTSKLGRNKAASHINTNNCVISLLGKHLALGAIVQNVIFFFFLFFYFVF